ncbi:hypothetical protein ALQ85_04844, partial [Pseudomonas syringae]
MACLRVPQGNHRRPDAQWWDTLAQVVRFQDCSGQDTHYRYDDRGHLIAVTDALNTTTTLERKPDGEVLRINRIRSTN